MSSTVDDTRTGSATRRAAPSYPQIVRILNLVRKEVEVAEIEHELKADPVITYRPGCRSPRAAARAGLYTPGRFNQGRYAAVADNPGLILPICDRITLNQQNASIHPAAPARSGSVLSAVSIVVLNG